MPSQIAGMNAQVLLLAFMALVVILLVTLAAMAVFGAPRARMKKRIASVVGHGTSVSVDPSVAAQTKKLQGSKRKVAEKLKEAETEGRRRRGAQLNQILIHAGLTMTPKRFVVLSCISGVVVTLLVWASGAPPIFLLAAAPIGALGLPKMLLSYLVKRRLGKFTALFADAIDIIVRGVRSGLTVGECLGIVAKEMPTPMGPEFALVNEGVRLGMTTAEVLQRLSDRVPTPEVRFFTIVLITQQTTGGNLAETLAKLSDVLRARKRMRDKVQAMSSEAKASAAIIGSLPFVMIAGMSVMQPKLIGLMFTHPTGHFLLGIGAGMMLVGMMVMRKMINFDI